LVDNSGIVSENGITRAQIQLVTNENDNRVLLYSPNGYFLCECPFDGNTDKGYEMGMALYYGYKAGWVNADSEFSRAIHNAINNHSPLEV
jgi:hypothetical protein